MAVHPTARPSTPAMSRAGFLVVPAAALILILGAAGVIDPIGALAAGVGGAALWATVLLVRAALAIHHAEGSFVACKGAGFVGMGALAGGLTATVPALVPRGTGAVATIGLSAASVMYVLGTMLLPGAATTWPVRLRRAFDGVGLGVSLAFGAWLITPMSWSEDRAALPSTLIVTGGVSIIVVTILRARPRRAPAVLCGIGSAAVLAGLSAIVNLVSVGLSGTVLPLIGLSIVAGLTLTARGGSRRDLLPPKLEPREPDQYLASYPLLAVPAAVGVIAAVYRLIKFGPLDRTGIILGLSMV
ncbi:MAG TPA: GGDEF domain-containing protein, partial [Actinoplanes sp.]|nr:GGDEF domain-containing protein [Actinoplanes sp.]